MARLELKRKNKKIYTKKYHFFQMDLYSNFVKHTMNVGTLVIQMKFGQSSVTRQGLRFFCLFYFVDWCFAYIHVNAPH